MDKESVIKEAIILILLENGSTSEIINSFDEENGVDERTVDTVFRCFDNTSEEGVLAKVIVLNQLYSTQLNDNPRIKQSQTSDIDKKTAVNLRQMAQYINAHHTDFDKIQSLEAARKWIVETCGQLAETNKVPYSFLTKYCAWSHPNLNIPIVDSYSKGMLYYVNRYCNKRHEIEPFFEKVTQDQLSDYNNYGKFCEIYSAFVNRFFPNCTYKTVDKFLWQYGKKNGIQI